MPPSIIRSLFLRAKADDNEKVGCILDATDLTSTISDPYECTFEDDGEEVYLGSVSDNESHSDSSQQVDGGLVVNDEDKDGFQDGDGDDDDTVLSLLSDLFATWSAEGDAHNANATNIHVPPPTNSCLLKLNSILKISSDTSEAKKNLPREQRFVAFDGIEIREYEQVVGDNPSCRGGPPISIGWSYTRALYYSLEDYEERRSPRRSKNQFYLAADRRTHMLVTEWDVSHADIYKARTETTYIQYCRNNAAFSGIQAAAREAAFLRKVHDPTKQEPSNQKVTTANDRSIESNSQPVSRLPWKNSWQSASAENQSLLEL